MKARIKIILSLVGASLLLYGLAAACPALDAQAHPATATATATPTPEPVKPWITQKLIIPPDPTNGTVATEAYDRLPSGEVVKINLTGGE